ncbi:biotin--[acetyl-CoA-carboxylase] ligase [Stygiolobus caldivivus]|uniref:Biotin--[acetyl-CoA-carboxylase] ligase n=1 Tax=Stygiolobus caldivivus TaxID=2824673 RepID=A0A8D5U8Z0_9CREN|nr:biotin--[acetyl-CoA-carboxylase] ligase [Stygiolobus caldivivus]BCU71427.1 biotin--[acetyl-CoA-carboxylase] ligase [Stygiolobus caldivivus]
MLIFKFPSITSTQDLAEAIYNMVNADKFVIVADEQTRARGRYRREWYSPKGGLWFTYVIKGFNPEKVPFTTLSVSLAIRDVLSKYIDTMIRWPNDIVSKNGKVSGILIEAIVEGNSGTAFIGAGIDTNVDTFPQGIKATSIKKELGKYIDNEQVLNEVIEKINEYLSLDEQKVIDQLNRYLSIRDKVIKIIGREWEKQCKALFVDFMGRLVTDCGIFEVEEVLRVEEV